jgi:hypothetical protein
VEEGVLVARSALRLAIKNRVIMATLRDGDPWNDTVMTELARAEIEALMGELAATAERLEASSAAPLKRRILSRTIIANLRQDAARQGERARILRRVVERLRETEEDADQTRALLTVARDDTLSELTQARLIPLDGTTKLTDEERLASIEGVKEDLRALLAQQELRDLPEGY